MADVITLNEIEEIKNLVATNNTESAVGTLSQKLTAIFNYITDRIGTTNATGGTTTAGTVMAKLNALLSSNANLTSANSNHGQQVFTSSGTWTAPAGVYEVIVIGAGGTGGGGGGGGAANDSYYDNGQAGGGGGGGAVPPVLVTKIGVVAGTAYTITIGAAGAGGAAGTDSNGRVYSNGTNVTGVSGSAGGAGGSTKFGSLFTFPGGAGGSGGTGGIMTYYYDGDTSYAVGAGGQKGSGGALTALPKGALLNWDIGIAGGAGGAGQTASTYSSSSYVMNSSSAGTAGGAKKNNFGMASGKGGTGSYYYTDATAGSSGVKGFLAVMW